MELFQMRSALRGLHPSWSLWKSTHHLKVTSSTWHVLSEDALYPLYPGTWTTSASTQTATITSPTHLVCAPCTFLECEQRTAVITKLLQSTLLAKQSVLLNLLLEVRFKLKVDFFQNYPFWFILILSCISAFSPQIKMAWKLHGAFLFTGK